MANGILIDVEGIDGSGKSTIAKLLQERLSRLGYTAVVFREPSDSEFGRRIREVSKSTRLTFEEEFNLLLKDRQIDVETNILPALSVGKVVIMDRYFYSHVYQTAHSMRNIHYLLSENRRIAPEPDYVFILDLPVEAAIKRIIESRKTIDKFESDKTYLEKVRRLYLEFHGQENVFFINALQSPDMILGQILNVFLKHKPDSKD